MTDWQPIETAPKDGTPVLLAFPPMDTHLFEQSRGVARTASVAVGWWDYGDFGDNCWNVDLVKESVVDSEGYTCAFSLEVQPTHWMPLPNSPDGSA